MSVHSVSPPLSYDDADDALRLLDAEIGDSAESSATAPTMPGLNFDTLPQGSPLSLGVDLTPAETPFAGGFQLFYAEKELTSESGVHS